MRLVFPGITGNGNSRSPLHVWKPGKIFGPKVNVKFFMVDPYSEGTGVPQTFKKLGKIQKKYFFVKRSTIKSEKNISSNT